MDAGIDNDLVLVSCFCQIFLTFHKQSNLLLMIQEA